MYNTTYHRAASADDAASKAGSASDASYLAGGQTLIAAMKTRLAAPENLIDLRHAGMGGVSKDGDSIVIGATTPHAEVAGSDLVKSGCPGLAALASHIGDPHVRHMGTIGGSIANNDPAADYPAAMLALGATIVTTSREIAAEDFFTGLFETVLDEGELVVSVKVPACKASAYQKFPNPASRYAMTGVFVAKQENGVRVAVTGAGSDGVFRWKDAEDALSSSFSADALSDMKPDANDLMSDIHASADYRANLVAVMTARAVRAIG